MAAAMYRCQPSSLLNEMLNYCRISGTNDEQVVAGRCNIHAGEVDEPGGMA